MRKYLLIALGSLLAACATFPASVPPSPVVVADTTVLDEKAAIAIESAYKATRIAIEAAVDAGIIKGAMATRVAQLDNRAFAAVQAVRAAYRAGNSASYISALNEARSAIGSLLSVAKG